jgi:mono/diheme cytochrome c family protein
MALAVAALAFLEWKRPRGTAFIRGRDHVSDMGCIACHSSPTHSHQLWFPAWSADSGKHPEAVLKKIREGGEGMPAYDSFSKGELADVMVYLEAIQGMTRGMPPGVARGLAVAERVGCLHCHGPNGRGGVGNPESIRNRILGFDDPEAMQWAENQTEIEEWIRTGTSRRVEDHWILGPALRRQAIRMPAFANTKITGRDSLDLLRYLRWMRGPGARP